MLKCPVCDDEYIENQGNCHTCGWNLRLSSVTNTTVLQPSFCQTVEPLKEIEAWARKIWHQVNQQQQKNQQNLQTQNPQSQNNKDGYLHPSLEKRLETIESYLKLLTVNSQNNPAHSNSRASDSNKNLQNSVNRKEAQKEFPVGATDILLSLAEAQLVGKYNQNPQKIFTKVTEVIISESSLNNNQVVIFEKSRRGNYWIINLENLTYLVPKNNFKLNQFNYDSFIKVFQGLGYKAGETSNFLLLKPAIVSSISIGKSWELREIGILQFDFLHSDEKSIGNQISPSTIDEQEMPINQPQVLLNEQNSNVLETLEKLNQVSQFTEDKAKLSNIQKSENQSSVIYDDIYLNLQEADILIIYNRETSSLNDRVKEVNIAEENTSKLHLESGKTVIFETKEGGSYWILEQKNIHYLLPKQYLVFNQYQYQKAQKIFQCKGYQLSSIQKFRAIKAARVTSISEDKWQLEEMGILKFSNYL